MPQLELHDPATLASCLCLRSIGKVRKLFLHYSLVKTGAINDRLAYSEFSWWLIRYWLCSKEYVEEVRNFDPYSWITLEKTAKKLHKEELSEGYTPTDYSMEKLNQFLEEESRLLIVDEQTNSYLTAALRDSKRKAEKKL